MLQVRRDKRAANEADGLRPGMFDKYIIRYPQYNEITGRYEHENNTLYIAAADFKKFCEHLGMSVNTMVRSLERSGIVMNTCRINLGAHVSWLPTSRMKCYVIESTSLDRLGWKPSAVQQMAPPQDGVSDK